VLRRLFSHEAHEPASFDVIVRGRPVEVAVRRNAAARRITLRVKNATGQVVLTLPKRASLLHGHDFAMRQVDWIADRLETVPEAVPFARGNFIPLRGVPHRLVWRGLRGVTRVEPQEPGRPRVIGVYGPEEHFSRRVSDFLKREAKKDIEPTVQRHASKLRVEIGRISVKDTISRWGSCSAKGDLAFSWRLILAPPFVLDYLCAHEVGHRREMNHGDRFWKIVYRLFPETEDAEAWLKAHGSDLHRYGMIPPEKRTRRSAQGILPLRVRG
jgi:predicted metal-dependent hydrolase